MKPFLILAFVFLSLAAMSQTKHCSYFMPNNWQFSYPQMFSAQISPADGTMTISPLTQSFAGIVSLSVHSDLTCGVPANCVFLFQPPVTSLTALPGAFFECAANSNPMYLQACWLKREEVSR